MVIKNFQKDFIDQLAKESCNKKFFAMSLLHFNLQLESNFLN